MHNYSEAVSREDYDRFCLIIYSDTQDAVKCTPEIF